MKAFTYFALIASCSAVRLSEAHKTIIESTGMHACDFIDDSGEEISTSLMPEYVQLNDEEPQEEAPASARNHTDSMHNSNRFNSI